MKTVYCLLIMFGLLLTPTVQADDDDGEELLTLATIHLARKLQPNCRQAF